MHMQIIETSVVQILVKLFSYVMYGLILFFFFKYLYQILTRDTGW